MVAFAVGVGEFEGIAVGVVSFINHMAFAVIPESSTAKTIILDFSSKLDFLLVL